MNISQLEYILAVDKHRNFSKAAKECFITQPTLSMQLQKLEEELGVRIFDRSKKTIIPTVEGEHIIKQAKVIIRENKRLVNIALESKERFKGSFKLGVIPTLAAYSIPLFAKKFADKYPDIKLIIEEVKTEDIIKFLDQDELDAGLLATPLHIPSVIEKVLYYEPFYLFVNKNHKLFKNKSVDQDDLDLYDIWLLNKGNCFRDQVLNICSKKNEEKYNENLKFESGNFETLKNMVLKHSGYTLLPHMAVEQMGNDMRQLTRPFKEPIPTREVSLVYSRKFHKQRVINKLVKEIRSSVPKELLPLENQPKEIIEIYT